LKEASADYQKKKKDYKKKKEASAASKGTQNEYNYLLRTTYYKQRIIYLDDWGLFT